MTMLLRKQKRRQQRGQSGRRTSSHLAIGLMASLASHPPLLAVMSRTSGPEASAATAASGWVGPLCTRYISQHCAPAMHSICDLGEPTPLHATVLMLKGQLWAHLDQEEGQHVQPQLPCRAGRPS